MSQAIVQDWGRFGPFTVEAADESKKFFVTIETEEGKKKVPVRFSRRTLTLNHDGGTRRTFSSYTHQGQLRFRDHTERSGRPTPSHACRELRRMLGVSDGEARRMLGAS